MEFQGGAGRFTLDFTGEWEHEGETQASIAIGVGALTMHLPSHLGVAVTLDRFLATFDRSGFVKRGDMYYSSNYEEAAAKLKLDINAVLGDINVVWVPR
jgi:predicted membrane protein